MHQSKRLLAAGGGGRRSSDGGFRSPVLLLLFLFVLAPSLFFAARGSIRAAPISPDDTSSPNFSSHRIISLTYLLHFLSRNATLFCLVSHLQTLLPSSYWREQYLLTAFGICAH
ncbi:unnamed protein product [Musa acuminata subsp. malaccensis]|uniref:(wild Malaysian banana) hypothetical protein n=1 Tax=Musa acuminata subsp. malaccensis TaxID=214687 RepID=A0A804L4V6_MUSAM|nr:unnamed protein product [Musa acuminata subsp. malaccensis]